MRTVRDAAGKSWICLEMPVVPPEAMAGAAGRNVVCVECNSGAERILVLVAEGWDDDLSDDALLTAIAEAR